MNVSHETLEGLRTYESELLKWNAKINLIGRSTEKDIVARHIVDSRQIYDLIGPVDRWCDMGSGGGLPGLVIAILARETPQTTILIEVDQRKATFLSHISRLLDLKTQIIVSRIEKTVIQKADVISARALAPLTQLLEYAHRHATNQTTYVFPKGARVEEEIRHTREQWRFSVERIPSMTAERSVILKIEGLSRV